MECLHGGLMPMAYKWGVYDHRKWSQRGSLVITPRGVLLDDERLTDVRYEPLSRSLVFGGGAGSFARTGRICFDPTQLHGHGTMELDDGATAHVIAFASYDFIYETTLRPFDDPDAPTQPGPKLRIQIDPTAHDGGSAGNPAIKYSLTVGAETTDVSRRVVAEKPDEAKHLFELVMTAGLDFPPEPNRFDVMMATDMTGFAGTYARGPAPTQKFTWVGRQTAETVARSSAELEAAAARLETAPTGEIERTAFAALLAEIGDDARVESPLASAAEATNPSASGTLPGLDAQDLAFLAVECKKGLNVAAIDNIRAVKLEQDATGKAKIVDKAQEVAATAMNTGTLNSLAEPWKTDFQIKPQPLTKKQQEIVDANAKFFSSNAELQMGSLLKYKQDSFSGVDLKAIQRINDAKLKEQWKLKTVKPERLKGFQKASNEMYGNAYAVFRSEFAAFNSAEKEQWGRAYFHWLVDPAQMSSWQTQLTLLDADCVSALIYEWHAKLSILAPDKPYAAQMEAYALASYIQAQALNAKWVAGAIPALAEALASGAKADPRMISAAGKKRSDPNASTVKQRLADLVGVVSAETVATALSAAAVDWQTAHGDVGGAYYSHLYRDPSAITEITEKMDSKSAAEFTKWAGAPVQPGEPSAGAILSVAVYAAMMAFLVAGLAPKGGTDGGKVIWNSGMEIPPDLAWALKGIKIGQVAINGFAGFFQFFFSRRVASLWTQFAGEEGQTAPELSEALAAISDALEDGEEVAGWGLAFGAGLSKVLKVAGPILALVGVGLSIYNLVGDILAARPIDGILDAVGALAGIVGAAVGFAVMGGLITSAAAGPIGLVIAIVGLVVLALKILWDWLFPKPTPIQKFVGGPLTDLGVVDPA